MPLTGSYVLNQILGLVHRQTFARLNQLYDSDYRALPKTTSWPEVEEVKMILKAGQKRRETGLMTPMSGGAGGWEAFGRRYRLGQAIWMLRRQICS